MYHSKDLNITDRLQSSEVAFALWTSLATFMGYFSMYMYRKPFTAATFENLEFWNIDFKITIVIAQVAGYALSKFAGIKIISELKNDQRLLLFLMLVFSSWLALVGFAFSPVSWGIFWFFLNGLPLGLIWGIVFSYCEGRKITELLTVVISINFILSSGFAKTLGMVILRMGYPEQMMPMTAGIITMPLLLVSAWMLSKIPSPTPMEINSKKERKPMSGNAKKKFVLKYWFPLLLFILIYLSLTIVRDIRDNFAPELWKSLGYGENAGIFSTTELPTAMILLIFIGLLYRIKDHAIALKIHTLSCVLGIFMLLGASLFFRMSLISGVWWIYPSNNLFAVPLAWLSRNIRVRLICRDPRPNSASV
jgi:hypothetical protein